MSNRFFLNLKIVNFSAKAFEPGNWRKLDFSERRSCLQQAENQMALQQGRSPRTVLTESMPDKNGSHTLGYYDQKMPQYIVLNEQDVGLSESGYQMLETTIHEGRHAYRHDAVSGKIDAAESIETQELWAKNSEPNCYVSPDEDIVDYRFGPLERDANDYADSQMNQVFAKSKDSSYYSYKNDRVFDQEALMDMAKCKYCGTEEMSEAEKEAKVYESIDKDVEERYAKTKEKEEKQSNELDTGEANESNLNESKTQDEAVAENENQSNELDTGEANENNLNESKTQDEAVAENENQSNELDTGEANENNLNESKTQDEAVAENENRSNELDTGEANESNLNESKTQDEAVAENESQSSELDSSGTSENAQKEETKDEVNSNDLSDDNQAHSEETKNDEKSAHDESEGSGVSEGPEAPDYDYYYGMGY